MLQLVKELANDTGITAEEVNNIFIAISGHLVNKIPALQQVIEDVFENAGDDTLKKHIAQLITSLQEQQRKETFGSWKIPQRWEVTHREGNYPLF